MSWLLHPVTLSHESAVHMSLSLQLTGGLLQPPTMAQRSWVQASPSLQSTGSKRHPVAGLQAVSVQSFPSTQETLPVGAQVPPPRQRSPSVHMSPSSQGELVAALLLTHWSPGTSQVWTVQSLGSVSHVSVATQLPPLHTLSVQLAPSSQLLLSSLTDTQSITGSQESSVQSFPSSQVFGLLPTQFPAMQL
jgi:hypothetical protein